MVSKPPGGGHEGDIGGIVRVGGADYDNGGAPVEDCGGDGLVGCGREGDCAGIHFV